MASMARRRVCLHAPEPPPRGAWTDGISFGHVVGQLLDLVSCHVLPHLLSAIREEAPHG